MYDERVKRRSIVVNINDVIRVLLNDLLVDVDIDCMVDVDSEGFERAEGTTVTGTEP